MQRTRCLIEGHCIELYAPRLATAATEALWTERAQRYKLVRRLAAEEDLEGLRSYLSDFQSDVALKVNGWPERAHRGSCWRPRRRLCRCS